MNIRKVLQRYGPVLLALVLVQVPVWFVWHTELVFDYNGGMLTNGFMRFDGMEIYHLGMYATYFVTNIAALKIVKDNYINNSKEE